MYIYIYNYILHMRMQYKQTVTSQTNRAQIEQGDKEGGHGQIKQHNNHDTMAINRMRT